MSYDNKLLQMAIMCGVLYFQGLNVTGKPSVLSSGGIRLVQPAVSGTGGGTVVAGGSATTGNLITIGGKQVLLTSKPFAQQGQLQQVCY